MNKENRILRFCRRTTARMGKGSANKYITGPLLRVKKNTEYERNEFKIVGTPETVSQTLANLYWMSCKSEEDLIFYKSRLF